MIIAIATLFGYFIIYRYESGFLDFFGIPDIFIEITLTSILIAGFVVFFLLLLLFNFFALFSIFYPKDFWPYSRSIIIISPFLLWLIIDLMLYGSESRNWTWLLGCLVVFSFLGFVFPLLRQRQIKGYREKLIAQAEAEMKTLSTKLYSRLFTNIDRREFLIFALILTAFVFPKDFGKLKARQQVNYSVINTSPEAVVLRTYGDKMLCIPFDRKNKEIQRRFFILKISDNTRNLTFSSEPVGPLHASIVKIQKIEKGPN